MDTYRELYLDKSDQLLKAMTAAIELQQENERLRKMIVEFGVGKVGVMRTAEQGEDFDSGLAFANQEAHSIGEIVPGRIGKTTDEVDCFLRFHFSNPASVQVLIDDLIIVRDSIAGGAECICENHTDNDGWRCNVCGLLSPHRKHEGGRTLLALDVCPSCAGKGTYQIGVFSETCSACHGTGKRQ